jgi:dTDP-4-dehydrorhamnose reductase
VRTAWLFAHGGKNFIQSILGAAAADKPLRVVVNEIANPTYNDDLAAAILSLIETERFGIYHFVNEGACSRYQFARYALDHAGYAETPIAPISASEWSRPSMPPVYSPMVNLAGKSIGISLRPWQQAVDTFLQREQLLIHEP